MYFDLTAMALPNSSKPAEDFSDDDLITCGICHTEMEDARSLVCLHTYCLECLRIWSKRSRKEVICPMCREQTPLQENGVDGLRRNFFVTKLKDRKKNKDAKITCTSCHVSNGNEAVARCLECDDFLCQDCDKTHKTSRLSMNHTVLTLEKSNISPKSKAEHCKDHPGQVLWFYCKLCDMPICRDCTVIIHPTNSHKLITIDEATAGQREEIKRLVRLCNVKKDEVDKGLKKINNTQSNIESTRNTLNNAIDETKATVKRLYITSLDKQTSDLKSKVSELMCARERAASTQKDKLQILNSRIISALDTASSVTRNGSDCDVASVYKHLTTTLQQLGQTTTPFCDSGNIRFIENVSLKTSVESIGRLKVDNVRWKLIREFGDSGKENPSGYGGLAITKDGSVAVTDKCKSEVRVYDIDSGELVKAIDTRHSLRYLSSATVCKSSPRDIVVYRGNYIVNDETQKLTVYSQQGIYVRQIPLKSPKNSYPTGLGINSIGHVLVGYHGYSNAKFIDIYRFADAKHIGYLNLPFPADYIAVSNTTDDRIVISNYWYGACVIDSRGQTIHKLRPPSNVTSVWRPKAVCTADGSDQEEVFVCNTLCTYGVYRFSLGTGKYLGCVTTNLRDPHGIAITTDRKLIVTDTRPACVRVFSEYD